MKNSDETSHQSAFNLADGIVTAQSGDEKPEANQNLRIFKRAAKPNAFN